VIEPAESDFQAPFGLRLATHSDLRSIARLFAEAFTAHKVSSLSAALQQKFIALHAHLCVTLVAADLETGRVLGFAIGGRHEQLDRARQAFIYGNVVPLALHALTRRETYRDAYRHLPKRTSRRQRASPCARHELRYLAVAADERGCGIGSALLQAMQERHVTVAGTRHDLPAPFHVLATQNPLEQEGAYPLPEAQLDRFLMQIDVGYPDRDAERRILIETTGDNEAKPKPAMTAAELMAAQRLVRRAPIGESVVETILDLVRAARPGEGDPELAKPIAWGPGPRASQALMLACRARALVDGRFAPSRDDVAALAEPVLKHRMALSYAARADGETIPAVVARLVARTLG